MNSRRIEGEHRVPEILEFFGVRWHGFYVNSAEGVLTFYSFMDDEGDARLLEDMERLAGATQTEHRRQT